MEFDTNRKRNAVQFDEVAKIQHLAGYAGNRPRFFRVTVWKRIIHRTIAVSAQYSKFCENATTVILLDTVDKQNKRMHAPTSEIANWLLGEVTNGNTALPCSVPLRWSYTA